MTPEYLKELLPSLLNADFAGATNVRRIVRSGDVRLPLR